MTGYRPPDIDWVIRPRHWFTDAPPRAPEPGSAPSVPPRPRLSRRRFLAVSGLVTLYGLGLSGGADLERPGTRQFGRVLEGVASDPRDATSPAAPPTMAPIEPAPAAEIARLVVPVIELDTPVSSLAAHADGSLPPPAGPRGVAWYTFSGTPSTSTNVVLAGHVSWRTGELTAFRQLPSLREGDRITLVDALDRRFDYTVFASQEVDPSGDHVAALLGPQSESICTLVSCDGWFDGTAYTKRRVVQAAL